MKRIVASFTIASMLVGCGARPLVLPAQLTLPASPQKVLAEGNSDPKKIAVEPNPLPPETAPNKPPAKQVATAARDDSKIASINLDQVPLPTFVKVVYSELLNRTVQIDPKVMERRDLVTIRTPAMQTAAEIESAVSLLLKSYGIAAINVGGMVRVVPDNANLGYLPEIRRGAALPETPMPMRPLFQLVELSAVRNTDVASWLKAMFGDRIKIQEDAGRNAVLLNGTSDTVAAAVEAIRILDQPVMRGQTSIRLTPAYWSAAELGKRLNEILGAEGYAVAPLSASASSGGIRYPILLLPIESVNLLLVFAQNKDILDHVLAWAEKLDQPNERSFGKGFFTYKAINTSADSLAQTLTQVLQGGGATAPAVQSSPGSPGQDKTASSTVARSSRVVVDKGSNSLIFQAAPDEYPQLLSLLRNLDKPTRTVLVEVAVAEVRLTDDMQLGVEWLLRESSASGTVIASTLGALALGTSGLTVTKLNSTGDKRGVLNALATSNHASILSTPSVVSRSGETASIQVGQEVPVITSQQSTLASSANNNLGVLQTVQYRNTGVILKVKPTVFSSDMVDLDVSQEVSSAQETTTGVTASPTIASRKVETKMSLRSGTTVLIGGLMSSNNSKGDTGIPFFKDIPIAGTLFGKDTKKQDKTELLVLITPYIMNDAQEASSVVQAFKERFGYIADEPPSWIPFMPKKKRGNTVDDSLPKGGVPQSTPEENETRAPISDDESVE